MRPAAATTAIEFWVTGPVAVSGLELAGRGLRVQQGEWAPIKAMPQSAGIWRQQRWEERKERQAKAGVAAQRATTASKRIAHFLLMGTV